MAHQNRQAFTLVELLIVISILGMLMAIALPGVMSVIETGYQKKCSDQLKELSVACKTYETDKQKGFPPYRKTITTEGGGRDSKIVVGWPVLLLNRVGKNDVYTAIKKGDIVGFKKTAVEGVRTELDLEGNRPHIEMYNCPSSAESVTADTINYVANTGRADSRTAGGGGDGGKKKTPDFKANGIFHDHGPNVGKVYVRSSNINKKTILMTENLSLNSGFGSTSSWASVTEAELGCVWWPEKEPSPDYKRPNFRPREGESSDASTPKMELARPASNHDEGFNVVFAGGSRTFLSQNIHYTVYARLMCVDGAESKTPGGGSAPQWLRKPVSESEMNP